MQFVIFHGSFSESHPQAIWFPQLRKKLETQGHQVIVPAFPTDNWEEITNKGVKNTLTKQSFQSWIATFKTILPLLGSQPMSFIGHSLGSLFILHVVEKFQLTLTNAVFVAPFLERLNGAWQIDLVNSSFYKTSFNFLKLRKLIPKSSVLYSNNDPYVPTHSSIEFGKKLGSTVREIIGAGHFNSESTFDPIPVIYNIVCSKIL
jgi:predicted alpha/beta hydrolase family esterase